MGAFRKIELEHAAEVWGSGGCSACRKLEKGTDENEEIVGKSNKVARVAVQGDLGWRKLEKRREEMIVLFGKRLEGMEESRLVNMVVKKLK